MAVPYEQRRRPGFKGLPSDTPLSQAKGRNGWFYTRGGITVKRFDRWTFDTPMAAQFTHAPVVVIETACNGKHPSCALHLTEADARDLYYKLGATLGGTQS